MNLIDYDAPDLKDATVYYFEEGRKAYLKWMELKLSVDDQKSLQQYVLDYRSFTEASLPPALEQEREAMYEVISYCDLHARDKNRYNKYPDSRVLAKAGIRMGPWIQHLFNYKYFSELTNTSVKYALDMLISPTENINVLSVAHRRYISTFYLKKEYDEKDFVNDLIQLCGQNADSLVRNADNLTCLIARKIYSEKHLWFPILKRFNELGPLLLNYISEKQLSYVFGRHDAKSFYWIDDTERHLCTLDAHYEIYKNRGNVISVDLHFEGSKELNRQLLDQIGELPEFLKLKNWQGSKSISHVDEFNFHSPDLLENIFECLDKLYDYTYPLIKDEINRRNMKQLNDLEIKTKELLLYKKQIILQGPPGTGKTRMAERIAESLLEAGHSTVLKKPAQISVEDIKRTVKEGQIFRSVTNYTDYEIMKLNDASFTVKTHSTGREYPATFANIIKYYKDETWSKAGTIKYGNDSYEAAIAKYICEHIEPIEQKEQIDNTDRLQIMQFHPSFTYEDFVRGIEANTEKDQLVYSAKNKALILLADKAILNPEKNYILILDEINRANLSAVLGELIYALEYRGKTVESMYEVGVSRKIVLPDNLYIIGTMNTADRSVGHIDYAIRRRFAFVDVLPKNLKKELNDDFDQALFNKVTKLFVKDFDPKVDYNAKKELLKNSIYLSEEFRPEYVWLGHSYFIKKDGATMEMRLEYEIKPILLEYIKDGVLKEEARPHVLALPYDIQAK
ncbi:AAA family ATPase [Sphingobacterium faecium]|uniref:AAA family ATPase n=1 Tax=Sphingobacterium faecium TaxID=34087 RepID=UPI002479DB87|nr:AAA family ATPase [Sphingobacterium faecium]WGQ15039.1 AAA family ATPase [Sphingobacterium faecium]